MRRCGRIRVSESWDCGGTFGAPGLWKVKQGLSPPGLVLALPKSRKSREGRHLVETRNRNSVVSEFLSLWDPSPSPLLPLPPQWHLLRREEGA